MLPMSNGLATDLYQLTMAAGYWRAGLTSPATFELFVRRLPESRGYLLAAGLDCALDFLERIAFSPADVTWLRGLPAFARVPREFFDDYLANLSFTGDVFAMPEGTPVFPHEPILRVTAPQPEAQLVETALLSIVSFQTSVATKAARIVDAAAGRTVIEFGARRAHGLESAMTAARAAYIGGCDGTSLVEAARRFGIPVSGTMAHAWVQTFADERAAFEEFNRTFADIAVYLLDTYDTIAAARLLATSNLRPPMVRLDSGDLDALSREVRRILDEAGLTATKIFATSDLDEYRIADLVDAGAPIDGFGVGTSLTTVSDAPALSAVYKLVEVQRDAKPVGVVKLSVGKATWPGAKQVWRHHANARMIGDVIAAADEPEIRDALPLLQPVMTRGRRVNARAPLDALRDACRRSVGTLPDEVRALRAPATYPVRVSETLEKRRTTLLRDRTR
jgi:nicotinate phosphoribosyltransferase